MSVDVCADDGLDVPGLEEAVAGWVAAMLDAVGLDDPEVSVRFVDDPAMRELNRSWRGLDSTTDVLSFPQQEPPILGGVLGDLVVSLPVARAQAAELHHPLDVELRVLLAHGLAHLLGHDHDDPLDADAMRLLEARFVAACGLDPAAVAGLVERAEHSG